jgi:hypothetical protein
VLAYEELQSAGESPDTYAKDSCKQRKNNSIADGWLSVTKVESRKSVHYNEEHPWAEPAHSHRHPIQPSPGRYPEALAKGSVILNTSIINEVTIAIASRCLHSFQVKQAGHTSGESVEFVKPNDT